MPSGYCIEQLRSIVYLQWVLNEARAVGNTPNLFSKNAETYNKVRHICRSLEYNVESEKHMTEFGNNPQGFRRGDDAFA